ncbi:flavin monoamine oxidase family protein [Aquipuribacter sp. SD81]|uniref:flavin monoamine oxidase family protein n=1 Tax=Aquipuribacter sp. SD81 TaxID=3127703 RepID=UPI0030179FA3
MIDVVVVGAGLAGLAAAEALVRDGAEVAVLEARDRVGGRVHDAALPDGGWVELGAQWVGTEHARVLGLARELGVATVAGHHRDGWAVEQRGGGLFRGRRPFDGARGEALQAAARLLADSAEAATRDPVAAAALRDATVASWTTAHVEDPLVRGFLHQALANEASADPGEVSAALLVDVLDGYLDGDGPLADVEAFRLRGGPQQLATGLAGRLPPGTLHLGQPVRAVRLRDGAVEVVSGDPARPDVTTAGAVVLAVPLSLVVRLHLDPPLPGPVDAALQRLPMASVVKAALVWERPVWREHDRSGLVVGDGEPWCTFVDSSPATDRPGAGVLTGFAVGAQARRLSGAGPDARRAALLAGVRRALGDAVADALGEPVGYVEGDWVGEEWTRGGYGPLVLPGTDPVALATLLREPWHDGRVVLASADLDEEWPSYMEGALRQGSAVVTRLAR